MTPRVTVTLLAFALLLGLDAGAVRAEVPPEPVVPRASDAAIDSALITPSTDCHAGSTFPALADTGSWNWCRRAPRSLESGTSTRKTDRDVVRQRRGVSQASSRRFQATASSTAGRRNP